MLIYKNDINKIIDVDAVNALIKTNTWAPVQIGNILVLLLNFNQGHLLFLSAR